MRVTLLVALLAGGAVAGPFDIMLRNTPKAPAAAGSARLVYAASPFGVAVTADGRSRHDVQVTASGLPDPKSIGDFTAYVAWEVTPDLKLWKRLGVVTNGTTTVGQTEQNKFLLVITAEARGETMEHSGPTVLHGISPSAWLQSFMSHPLFRGISG